MPRTQRHESHHEIFQLEEAWRNAVMKADIPALDCSAGRRLHGHHRRRRPAIQGADTGSLRSGATHFTAIDVSDRKVRFYGTTALVTSKAVMSGTHAGVDISGSYRYTRVYVTECSGRVEDCQL